MMLIVFPTGNFLRSDQIPFTKCNPALDSGVTRGSLLHKEDGLFW